MLSIVDARKSVSLFKVATSLAAFLTLAVPANAQQQAQPDFQPLNSIEVLVNDEPISSFDINQRLRLVIAVSGGVRTQEEFLQVREQVIQSMVDERLQMQEAAEVELEVPDAQLEQFFARRAQGVGQEPEQFAQALSSIGSSKETMKKQMEAEIAWSQLVQGRLGAFVSVSDEEVEAFIQRIYDNRGKFEYRLGEIVLLSQSPEQSAAVAANATQLVEQIRAGAQFGQIAQQLSASSSAAVGGDLGCVEDVSAVAYLLEVLPRSLERRLQQRRLMALTVRLGVDDDLVLGVHHCHTRVALHHAVRTRQRRALVVRDIALDGLTLDAQALRVVIEECAQLRHPRFQPLLGARLALAEVA